MSVAAEPAVDIPKPPESSHMSKYRTVYASPVLGQSANQLRL
jgi:hypothetical protein